MDFECSEGQLAVRELAKKILGELVTPEALARAEAQAQLFDREVWLALARAQLLGLGLPMDVAGSALGMVELCLLLEQAGEVACPLPLLSTLVLAALPIARFGSAAQRAELLEPVCRGERVLSAAFGSAVSGDAIVARRAGSGWLLTGDETCVAALPLADRVLVAARSDAAQALAVFVVDVTTPGVRIETQAAASGHVLGSLQLREVRVSDDHVIGDAQDGAAIVEWALDRAYLGQCAFELGLAQRALALTARYASARQQFGRPIGTFQAVAQRLADAHIDVETMRLTLWRAAWLTDQDRDARAEIAVAKIVASEAGQRVVCAAQHIHAGVGFDRSYPLHRYFLHSKQQELMLGGSAHHLARLGRMLEAG